MTAKNSSLKWTNKTSDSFRLDELVEYHHRAATGSMLTLVFLLVVATVTFVNNLIGYLELGITALFILIFISRYSQERKFESMLLVMDVNSSPKAWLEKWKEYYAKRQQLSRNLKHATPILLLGIWSIFLNLSASFETSTSYRIGLIIAISALLIVAYVYSMIAFKKESDMHASIQKQYEELIKQFEE